MDRVSVATNVGVVRRMDPHVSRVARLTREHANSAAHRSERPVLTLQSTTTADPYAGVMNLGVSVG